MIEKGQNLLKVSKRGGKTADYNIILNDLELLGEIPFVDTSTFASVKNFGQKNSSIKEDIIVNVCEDNVLLYPSKTIPLTPTSRNGLPIPIEQRQEIEFNISDIVLVEPLWQNPYKRLPSSLWILPETGVSKQQPINYTVEKDIEDIWFYFKNGYFPNPYYGGSDAVGGEDFLLL